MRDTFKPYTGRKFKRKGEVVVLTLGLFLLALVLFLVYQTWLTQKDADKNIGRLSPAQSWIERHMFSYSQNVYDMSHVLLRTKSGMLLYAHGLIDKEEYGEYVNALEAKYLHFKPGGEAGRDLVGFASFAPSVLEVGKYIEVSKALSNDKRLLASALSQADLAMDEWALLNTDSVSQEFGLRDVLEGSVVRMKVTLDSAIRSQYAILILCAIVLVISMVVALKYLHAVRSRSDSIERLVQSVGHDLRSPLQSITLATSLLEMERNSHAESNAPTSNSIKVIRSSVRTLKRLVDDIVQIVREERLEYRPAAVDVLEWYESFCASYKAKAEGKGLQWVANSNLDWRVVEVDQDRLWQCFGNLVDNAIKYSDSGTVRVSLELNWVRHKVDSHAELLFRCSDDGIGIHQEDQNKIFLPFFRSGDNAARSGMGLGLSIVQSLLRNQGGDVKVRSKLGMGSTFTAYLPVRTGHHSISSTNSQVALPVSPRLDTISKGQLGRILVVEDDPSILQGLSSVLQAYGFSVTAASNGQEALNALKDQDYPVVVSDIQMPVMDGFALAKHCRALANRPFFIAQTAYTTELDQHQEAHLFDERLSKPVDEGSLLEKIHLGLAARQAS